MVPDGPLTMQAGKNKKSNDIKDDEGKARLSFGRFLTSELNLQTFSAEDDHMEEQELLYNFFLALPYRFERLMILGFNICLDSLLFMFTYLPLRFLVALVTLIATMVAPVRCQVRLSRQQRRDLIQVLLITMSLVCLNAINISLVYHFIRGQSVLKLYVIFNMLQLTERLLCSIGEDILEALFGGLQKGSYQRSFCHLVIANGYVFLHALVVFCHVITLNVSVNSNSNALFVLLVSNNFIEIKSCVFKRFAKTNLFQITCSDVVERFQLLLYILLILIQNSSQSGPGFFSSDWVHQTTKLCLAVFASELVIDWAKHGFITKFNKLDPEVYDQFRVILCHDFTAAHCDGVSNRTDHDRGNSVSRRFGFAVYPLTVLILRISMGVLQTSSSPWVLKLSFLFVLFLVLLGLKVLISVVVLGHSAKVVLALTSVAAVDAEKEQGASMAEESDVEAEEYAQPTSRRRRPASSTRGRSSTRVAPKTPSISGRRVGSGRRAEGRGRSMGGDGVSEEGRRRSTRLIESSKKTDRKADGFSTPAAKPQDPITALLSVGRYSMADGRIPV